LAGLNLEIDLPVKKACLNKFAKIWIRKNFCILA
jgi:hypothetical protein